MGNQYEGVVVLLREIYYRDLVILMFFAPIGLLLFKLGMSSKKHRIATLTQNLMLMPVMIISFFLFGWFFYKGLNLVQVLQVDGEYLEQHYRGVNLWVPI